MYNVGQKIGPCSKVRVILVYDDAEINLIYQNVQFLSGVKMAY